MANALYIEIITPSKVVFKGNIESVTIPGVEGSFQVLKNHAPLISVFEIGPVKIKVDAKTTRYFATGGGTVEVLKNNILVLADSLEAVEEVDVERARKARERAQERIANPSKDTELERASSALLRAVNRLTLVEKHIRAEV